MANLVAENTHNADELAQYSSLSTAAVAALLLGLLSPLAFLGPLGLAVPLLAVAVGLLALARINATGSALTGRPLARAGIALAVGFAVASIAHVYIRDQLAIRQAARTGDRWLNLVSAGKLEEALEIMTPAALMTLQPPPPTRDQPPPPYDPIRARLELSEEQLTHALEPAAAGAPVQFQHAHAEYYWAEGSGQVGFAFQATGAQAPEVEGTLVLTRKVSPEAQVVWLVNNWKLTKPEPKQFEAQHHHH